MQPIGTHTISVQSAKPSDAYLIMRLPHEFRRLAGAAATIDETTHDGALCSWSSRRATTNGAIQNASKDEICEKTSLYIRYLRPKKRMIVAIADTELTP
jgi:hypothetical protein